MGSFVMGGPPKPKTVVIPGQKYPEACVWQPTSNLLVFFVEYTFIGIWVRGDRQPLAAVEMLMCICDRHAQALEADAATSCRRSGPCEAAATS